MELVQLFQSHTTATSNVTFWPLFTDTGVLEMKYICFMRTNIREFYIVALKNNTDSNFL